MSFGKVHKASSAVHMCAIEEILTGEMFFKVFSKSSFAVYLLSSLWRLQALLDSKRAKSQVSYEMIVLAALASQPYFQAGV